jgi:hypothetical protein
MYEIKEVDNISMAFGVGALELMPAYKDIPDAFKQHSFWSDLVAGWFLAGLENLDLKPKDGVNKNLALRHIKAILGSFEPKHEHKEAGIAFLLSEWFEEEGSTWTVKAFRA